MTVRLQPFVSRQSSPLKNAIDSAISRFFQQRSARLFRGKLGARNFPIREWDVAEVSGWENSRTASRVRDLVIY